MAMSEEGHWGFTTDPRQTPIDRAAAGVQGLVWPMTGAAFTHLVVVLVLFGFLPNQLLLSPGTGDLSEN